MKLAKLDRAPMASMPSQSAIHVGATSVTIPTASATGSHIIFAHSLSGESSQTHGGVRDNLNGVRNSPSPSIVQSIRSAFTTLGATLRNAFISITNCIRPAETSDDPSSASDIRSRGDTPSTTYLNAEHLARSRVVDDLSATNTLLLRELPDGRLVVDKKILASDASFGVQDPKARAANEVFAYMLSERLGLGIVPEVRLVDGEDGRVIVAYIEERPLQGELFDRAKTSMLVFDFILNSWDRYGVDRNIIHGVNGKSYAIDHEWILSTGREWVSRQDIGVEQLRLAFPNDTAKEKFLAADWSAFFDANLGHWNAADRLEAKAGFMDRISFIKEQLQLI